MQFSKLPLSVSAYYGAAGISLIPGIAGRELVRACVTVSFRNGNSNLGRRPQIALILESATEID